MEIVTVPLDTLAEDPDNVRKHGERNLEAIRSSLVRFGQRLPLIVRNGVVVVGNGRLRVMRELGWTEAKIIQADDMSEDEVRVFAVAENRPSDLAGWDDAGLAKLFRELPSMDATLADAVAFDDREIQAVLDRSAFIDMMTGPAGANADALGAAAAPAGPDPAATPGLEEHVHFSVTLLASERDVVIHTLRKVLRDLGGEHMGEALVWLCQQHG